MTVELTERCPCCLGPAGGYISACMPCFAAHHEQHEAEVGKLSVNNTELAVAWYRAKGERLRAEGKMPALKPTATKPAFIASHLQKAYDKAHAVTGGAKYTDVAGGYVCPGCSELFRRGYEMAPWCTNCYERFVSKERAAHPMQGIVVSPDGTSRPMTPEELSEATATAEALARAAGSTLTRMGDRPWATGPIRILWCFTCKAAPGTHFGPGETPECDHCLAKRVPAASRFTSPVTTASVVLPGNDVRYFTPASLARALFEADSEVQDAIRVADDRGWHHNEREEPYAVPEARMLEIAWQRDEGGRKTWATRTAEHLFARLSFAEKKS